MEAAVRTERRLQVGAECAGPGLVGAASYLGEVEVGELLDDGRDGPAPVAHELAPALAALLAHEDARRGRHLPLACLRRAMRGEALVEESRAARLPRTAEHCPRQGPDA